MKTSDRSPYACQIQRNMITLQHTHKCQDIKLCFTHLCVFIDLFKLNCLQLSVFVFLCIYSILGPPALKHAAVSKDGLIRNARPIYNYSMRGVVTCFTGIRKKDELVSVMILVLLLISCTQIVGYVCSHICMCMFTLLR